MKPKRWGLFLILIFSLSLEVSCSSQRKNLLNSLPYDDSWFTRAKRIALQYGKTVEGRPLYIWSSKKVYINGEILKYEIWYFTLYAEAVTLSKKHGSFQRVIVYNEGGNKYYLSDHDFDKLIGERYITKEEAEELTYYFLKELDKYGLL
jgi:hypothetical protein